jgi:hypothetical protein
MESYQARLETLARQALEGPVPRVDEDGNPKGTERPVIFEALVLEANDKGGAR